jgi:membrane AbrB-like protein
VLLALAVTGLTLVLAVLKVPSPALFAGLLAGGVYALRARVSLKTPAAHVTAGQAIIGVTIGAQVQVSMLDTIAARWVPVLLITLATLVLSLAAGLVLGRLSHIDRVTASFGMIAGGASGLTAVSRQLGADERLVAVMQYIRVLIIVISTPVVAHVCFAGTSHAGAVLDGPRPGVLAGTAFTAACAVAGLLFARLVRLPVGSLLGPMLVSAAVVVAGVSPVNEVPVVVQSLGYALIGLQVGLRFTPGSLRSAGRLLPTAIALTVILIVSCAGVGVAVARSAHVSALDAYLATTPGGLYVVLATAVESGANTTFVLTVQVLRLFIMLLAAPVLARALARRRSPSEENTRRRRWSPTAGRLLSRHRAE